MVAFVFRYSHLNWVLAFIENMKSNIKDHFSCSVGHGVAGIDCGQCSFYLYDQKTNGRICRKNNVIIDLPATQGSTRKGERVCLYFSPNDILEQSQAEFESIKLRLKPGMLYGANAEEYLYEKSLKDMIGLYS